MRTAIEAEPAVSTGVRESLSIYTETDNPTAFTVGLRLTRSRRRPRRNKIGINGLSQLSFLEDKRAPKVCPAIDIQLDAGRQRTRPGDRPVSSFNLLTSVLRPMTASCVPSGDRAAADAL